VHAVQTRLLVSPPPWQAVVWYCDATQFVHAVHPEVTVPAELHCFVVYLYVPPEQAAQPVVQPMVQEECPAG